MNKLDVSRICEITSSCLRLVKIKSENLNLNCLVSSCHLCVVNSDILTSQSQKTCDHRSLDDLIPYCTTCSYCRSISPYF